MAQCAGAPGAATWHVAGHYSTSFLSEGSRLS